MRLIDADALLESFKCTWAFLSDDDYIEAVINAPTVESEASSQQDSEPVVSKAAYRGAREDLLIWKKRALEAEEKVRIYDQRIVDVGVIAMTPPKREWVGLSDEVIDSLAKNGESWNEHGGWYFDADKFAKAIEAKLKEVNGYD